MRQVQEFELRMVDHNEKVVDFEIRRMYESQIKYVTVYRNSEDFMRTLRAALHKGYGILGQISVEFSSATDVFRVATMVNKKEQTA